jgi:hypothetical protein
MILLLIQDSLVALALAAVLYLFLGLKRETLKHSRRIAALTRQLREIEARGPETVFLPGVPRSGLNLNKRVQATRLLRRGEDTSHVAAALGVPQTEVELLVRVQAMGKASGA